MHDPALCILIPASCLSLIPDAPHYHFFTQDLSVVCFPCSETSGLPEPFVNQLVEIGIPFDQVGTPEDIAGQTVWPIRMVRPDGTDVTICYNEKGHVVIPRDDAKEVFRHLDEPAEFQEAFRQLVTRYTRMSFPYSTVNNRSNQKNDTGIPQC